MDASTPIAPRMIAEEAPARLAPAVDRDEDDFDIPTWDDLQRAYEAKWLAEKAKFHAELKANFRALTEQFRSGRQEIHRLSVTPLTSRYEQAFRELFSDTGYQATVSEPERNANGNRTKRMYITLPTHV